MRPAERFRVYAALLRLYPKAYRKQYGEQLLQTVADMLDDAPRGERFGLWLRISRDLPVAICKTHLHLMEERMDTKNIRNANRNALIGGILFLLPIAILAINRGLMLREPGGGIPTVYLVWSTLIFPILGTLLTGFTMYTVAQNRKGQSLRSWRQDWPLAFVCLASVSYLVFITITHLPFYV